MTTAERCLAKAQELDRLVRCTADPQGRVALMEGARQWRLLAKTARPHRLLHLDDKLRAETLTPEADVI